MRVRFPDGRIEERSAAELRRFGPGALQLLQVEVETRDPFEPDSVALAWVRGTNLAEHSVDVTGRVAAAFAE